ncbi:hypothetical protein CFC21_099200 [Triticum aestivum]|uniref:Uncharacterized protein n=3 Tax=Triticum TaxID=4564 RepID=A0A9R1BSX2_TRITD|nr:putative UPF0496 protein 2 [Triticum aestivum]KAF7097376.1 hypothetical protein CFC21_099200 [Triticum aestivum]VAI78836.1 unnamed protein product [Triticum turgidum subsp. durum]
MEMLAGVQDGLNIEQEYINAMRTQSNVRFLSNKEEMEALLQPQQDLILPMLHKMGQKKSAEIKLAMSGYFDASAEASEICKQLLRNIKNTESNYQSMDSFLASIGCTTAPSSTSLALETIPGRSNPFSTTTRSNFRQIHDRYSSVLKTIKSSHRKVAKKLKIVKIIKKLSRTCLVIAGGAVAIGIAAHLLVFSLLVGSALMGLCPIAVKRRVTRLKRSKTESLQQLQEQLDTAAKGTYVLGRDFDTVSQLAVRLSDGIERENAMATYCMEMVDEKYPVQEMVLELRRSCSSSRRLAIELEEHVGLCLATIHRARVLVIEEISKQA